MCFIIPDDESVSIATEDKAKDNESIAVKSVATESTTEASKVILRFLKKINNATVYMDIVVGANFHHIMSRWKANGIAKF